MSDLIDRQALQNRLGRIANVTMTTLDVMKIVASQPTIAAQRWVRCEDALPEIGQRVIVYDGWMQFMTRKDDQRLNGKMYWENEEGNWERVDDEAYWMPIEPPKDKED